jgi:cysteine-rich repeat protein
VQVATNGADPTSDASYDTVFHQAAGTGGDQTIGGLDATARYVRIYSRARGTQWGNSLYEVELKGDPNPTCVPAAAVCGNGVLEPGESCDDGNMIGTDGCTNACQMPACGDALCSASETCSTCGADCGACPARSIANNLEAEDNDGMLGLINEPTLDVGGGQNAGYIETGDYVQWQVNVPTAGPYKLTSRSATWLATSLQVHVDGTLLSTIDLGSTWNGTGNQFQTWNSFGSNNFNLSAGVHTLRVIFMAGGQNLNWVKLALVAPAVCGNGVIEGTEMCDDGNTVNADNCTNACKLPLCGDLLCSSSETCSSCAQDCGACPGRDISANLEAESNDGMLGVQYEATSDTGAGQNAGFIDNGDYIEWKVNVPTAGSYTLTSRSATWVASSLQVRLNGGATLATLSLPKTWPGGANQFQTWASFTTTAFNLPAGTHTLRVTFTAGNQNLNWVKLAPATTNLLTNGAFPTDLLGWTSFFNTQGNAVWEGGSAKITPISSGTDWWAQFFQSRTVTAGNYKLTANAQAVSGTKVIALFCEQDGGAFTNYGQANCNLTTSWNTGVGCSVTCNGIPANTPIKFGVKGGLTNKAFRLDNVVLTKL